MLHGMFGPISGTAFMAAMNLVCDALSVCCAKYFPVISADIFSGLISKICGNTLVQVIAQGRDIRRFAGI